MRMLLSLTPVLSVLASIAAVTNYLSLLAWGLTRWLSSKESACWCRRCRFSSWVGKMPWKRKWRLTPVFLSGKFHGHRSLGGYSPCSCKEWNMTKHTHKWLKTTQIYHLTLLEVRNLKWVLLGDIAPWGSRKKTVFSHFQVLETPTILWAMTPF